MGGGLLAAFVAELALVTYRALGRPQVFQGQTQSTSLKAPPLPSEYVAAVAVYGALSLIPEGTGSDLATVLGWGFVVATLLNLFPAVTAPGQAQGQTAPSQGAHP